jgi:3-isopropylmalate dehydrogenase
VKARLVEALPGWTRGPVAAGPRVVGVLAGEGVGPEVVGVALDVLGTLAQVAGEAFDIRRGGPIGSESQRLTGKSLNDEAALFCDGIFAAGGALFCGPGGARFVYDLRKRFDLYCKFTPLVPSPYLEDAGPLRPERLRGVDIVAVRENVGGLYFGEGGEERDGEGRRTAFQRFAYREDQVERILGVAARLAASRRGSLAVVVKREGVPAVGQLWLDCVERLRAAVALDIEVLDIDNAVYQLIARAPRFDVIVSSNMFGDVLADCGALLLGSRGLSYSGNFGEPGRAVYQTGHGAAYDIAGTGKANPAGQILSAAMMLEESFGWIEGARCMRRSLDRVLGRGIRTADVAGTGHRVVGTREFGAAVCDAIRQGWE